MIGALVTIDNSPSSPRISKGINSTLGLVRSREVVIGNVLIVVIEGVVGTLNDRLDKIDNLWLTR